MVYCIPNFSARNDSKQKSSLYFNKSKGVELVGICYDILWCFVVFHANIAIFTTLKMSNH